MTTPTFTADCSTRTVKFSMTGLESSVSRHLLDLGEHGVGDLTVDLELEPLALTDVGHTLEAQSRQRAEHGLALGVEDLGLGHDVDDDTGHGGAPSEVCECAASLVPGCTHRRLGTLEA